MTKVIHGLAALRNNKDWQQRIKGNVGYLCNSASVDTDLTHGINVLKKLFGNRLKKVFSPQHGLFSDEQDDMLESPHFEHPYFALKVYSLYSETRAPKQEWLEDLDHLIVDLQDVGTRVYTYIYSLALTMVECKNAGVKVIVLDRPNPIGGEAVEGNVLEAEFASFVGMYELPMRHGLTIGEFALLANKYFDIGCDLTVIPLENWKRSMHFKLTALPWVLPSPNLPNSETAFVYPGSVLFEGTNISEGRGTVKSLEVIGHPEIEPFSLAPKLQSKAKDARLMGFTLRPITFLPTFHKFKSVNCGGFQIHVTDPAQFKPWRTGQLLMRELYHYLGPAFEWKPPPYEYEYEKLPIDILNGTDEIRKWIEKNGSMDELISIENKGMDDYMGKRDSVLLYS